MNICLFFKIHLTFIDPSVTFVYFCTNRRNQRAFQFEIVINVLVRFCCFFLIPMLWVYDYYKLINSFFAGTVFRCRNLTSNGGPRAERVMAKSDVIHLFPDICISPYIYILT